MDALDVIPVKSNGIDEVVRGDTVHLVRDKGTGASLSMKFLIWARQTPRYHRVDIDDPVGVKVWELIDGERSVGTIVDALRSQYGARAQFRDKDRKEMAGLTIQFLRMLYAARLIRYKK